MLILVLQIIQGNDEHPTDYTHHSIDLDSSITNDMTEPYENLNSSLSELQNNSTDTGSVTNSMRNASLSSSITQYDTSRNDNLHL